ncbi:hypothetical protein BASA83_004589 [Batrachochytrium salamandrivorans]|nr:hypothetical protein BASA83_004589 [Batrachochytrium salamandrivorans]
MTDSSSDPNHVQTNSSTKDSLIQSAYSSKVIILLSSTNPGTSLKHFIQVYSVCSTVFNTVHIATTTGLPPIWAPVMGTSPSTTTGSTTGSTTTTTTGSTTTNTTNTDSATAKWLADKHNLLKHPLALDTLDPLLANYSGFVVPDADGFYFEPQSPAIHSFLEYFLKFRKPICLIGSGTAVLFSTEPTRVICGCFDDMLLLLLPTFRCKNESLHIVIDDNIVTAQTKNSTLIAIQAFTLLCNR